MNIIQQADALKSLPDQALQQELLRPSSAPSYLVLSELQRRKEMRANYQAQGGKPNGSLAEEFVRGLGGAQVGNYGEAVRQTVPGSMQTGPDMRMPGSPPMSPQEMGGQPPQGMPQGMPQGPGEQPPQGFADGGEVIGRRQREFLNQYNPQAPAPPYFGGELGNAPSEEYMRKLREMRTLQQRFQDAMAVPQTDAATRLFQSLPQAAPSDNTGRELPEMPGAILPNDRGGSRPLPPPPNPPSLPQYQPSGPPATNAQPNMGTDVPQPYQYPLNQQQILDQDRQGRIDIENPNIAPPLARDDTYNRPGSFPPIQNAPVPPPVNATDFFPPYQGLTNTPQERQGVGAFIPPEGDLNAQNLPPQDQASGPPRVPPGGRPPGGALPPGPGGAGGAGGAPGAGGGAAPAGVGGALNQNLGQFVGDVRGMQAPDRFSELENMNRADREKLAGQLEGDKGMALLAAGLGIMGGTSPFPAVNIGRGAMAGVQSWNDASKEMRLSEMAIRNADQQIAIARASRDERQLEMAVKTKMHAQEMAEKRADRAASSGAAAGARADAAAARREAIEDAKLNRQEVREQHRIDSFTAGANKYGLEADKLMLGAKDVTVDETTRKQLMLQAEQARKKAEEYAQMGRQAIIDRELNSGRLVKPDMSQGNFGKDINGNPIKKGQMILLPNGQVVPFTGERQ